MSDEELNIDIGPSQYLMLSVGGSKNLQVTIHDGATYITMEASLDTDQVKQLIDFLHLHFGNTPE